MPRVERFCNSCRTLHHDACGVYPSEVDGGTHERNEVATVHTSQHLTVRSEQLLQEPLACGGHPLRVDTVRTQGRRELQHVQIGTVSRD